MLRSRASRTVLDFALDTALAKPARHEYRVHVLENAGAVTLYVLALDIVNVDPGAGLDTGMHQGFGQRDVGVAKFHVLADHGDIDFRVGILARGNNAMPLAEVGRRRSRAELADHEIIHTLLVQHHRNFVQIIGIVRRNNRILGHVRKQRDLAALLTRQRQFRAADQYVGLDTDRTQLLDGMLRRLGLDLFRRRNVRHERQVDVDTAVAPQFDAKLTNSLQERQRLDVADRTTDLDQTNVGITGAAMHGRLDLVGDVRNHLDSRTEVFAAALLADDSLVDAPGRVIGVSAGGRAHEALVVTQVEIGLGAIICDEDLAMLERTHRPGVDVDVRVQLDHADRQTS